MRNITIKFFGIIFLLTLGWSSQMQAKSGNRFEIKSVHFQGNHAFSEDHLRSIMVSKSSSLFKNHFFHSDVLKNDLDNIVRFYQQQGFLGAKVTGYQVNRDTSRHEVHIAIDIHEGPRSYVKAISLTDNRFFSGEKLGKQITLKQGDPLLQKKIDQSTNNMLNLYSDNGFLDAQIQTDVTLMADSQQAFVDFTIHEGPQYKIGSIEIKNLNFTRPDVVKRELTFKKGQIIDYSKLLKSQRQLYLTGLFRSVFISLKPPEASDSTFRTVLIDISEKAPAQFNVSGGYGSVEKFRVRSELYYDNLWGTARKTGIAAKYSSLYLGAEASFTEPWTFHTRFRTDLNLFANYLKEPGYNLRSIGALLTVGRKFLQRSNVLISYRHENNYLSDIKVTQIPQRPENRVRGFKLNLIYDTRDNIFNSTRGTYIQWSNEIAGLFFAGQVQFYSTILTAKYFYPATRSTVLAMGLSAGWIRAPGGINAIPLNERFYTGGPNELRAFGYQEVGPLDQNGIPLGGNIKLVWNVFELRQTIYKMFGMAVFGELGNIYLSPGEIKFSNLRQSLGTGLRVNSPVGLLRLDYAFNLSPLKGEPRTQLYFSVGQAF